MSQKTGVIIIIVVFLLILGIGFLVTNKQKQEIEKLSPQTTKQPETTELEKKSETEMKAQAPKTEDTALIDELEKVSQEIDQDLQNLENEISDEDIQEIENLDEDLKDVETAL